MYAKFEHKIKTPQQLAELVGRRPRRRRVIMCHGTFDIVHPGHMRHLMYAKEKADVLVVSVTADEHISKGPYRPYVPQELRAANLGPSSSSTTSLSTATRRRSRTSASSSRTSSPRDSSIR